MNKAIYILLVSLLSFNALGQKSNLVDFQPSSCDHKEDVDRIRERISEIYLQQDTLVVNVGFVANCAYSEEPIFGDACFDNDTLYLKYDFKHYFVDTLFENGDTVFYQSLNYYECDCCFEFTYIIAGVHKKDMPIKLNDKIMHFHPEKYKTYPIEYDIYNGDTINFTDKYGVRQGRWVVRGSTGWILQNRIYRNDTITKGVDYRYFESGAIQEKLEWIDNAHENYYEYDIDGKIILHKRSPFEL